MGVAGFNWVSDGVGSASVERLNDAIELEWLPVDEVSGTGGNRCRLVIFGCIVDWCWMVEGGSGSTVLGS